MFSLLHFNLFAPPSVQTADLYSALSSQILPPTLSLISYRLDLISIIHRPRNAQELLMSLKLLVLAFADFKFGWWYFLQTLRTWLQLLAASSVFASLWSYYSLLLQRHPLFLFIPPFSLRLYAQVWICMDLQHVQSGSFKIWFENQEFSCCWKEHLFCQLMPSLSWYEFKGHNNNN